MFKGIALLGSSVLLSGCGFIAGMENINTNKAKKNATIEQIKTDPVLMQITPNLLLDKKVSVYHYRVAPADVLSITVWDHPEFMQSGTVNNKGGIVGLQGASPGQQGYLVNSNGDIFFPLVGYVRVVNKTTEEIRHDITVRLEKYIPNPQVNVTVSEFRGQKVYILGAVEKVGFLPITDQRLTLADALAYSGWMKQDSADTRAIYVIRGDYTHPLIFWLNANTPDRLLLAEHFSLQPQDILYVSNAPITRITQVFNQILPLVQAIWFTQAVIKNA